MWIPRALALLVLVPSLSAQSPRGSSPPPTPHAMLAAEYARGSDTRVLDAGVSSGDTVLQRLAARAFGRMERGEFAGRLTPLLTSPAASVRREAAQAFGQMNVAIEFDALLNREKDLSVRAAIYETIGRAPTARGAAGPSATPAATPSPSPSLVAVLTRGLDESGLEARVGAARGMESLLRRTARSARPSAETVGAIRRALQQSLRSVPQSAQSMELSQLLLLALTAAADRDSMTFALALRDTSAQVRRLAVAAARQWVEDPSPLVRYQALRVAGTCARATSALRDSSAHVVLTAIDVLGEKGCEAVRVDSLVNSGANWRVQTRALMVLARLDSSKARAALPRLAQSPVWQARAWSANAAKLLRDSSALRTLARDPEPNVAIAAMSTHDDALTALRGTHSGLVLAGANFLKTSPRLAASAPAIADAVLRLSARRVATNRDPRIALLQRLHEAADSATAARIAPLTRDLDPEVATLAAKVVSDRAHIAVSAQTVRYSPAPFPTAATLGALRGATAVVRVKGLGTLELALLPDDAPVTVATFVQLAERGAFNGLTWHRIVPNFVVQGGSPGADEYDGITATFLRDEVGFARHARGTFGISTRGRDTGDGQLFINLVDNFRLDHDYTVFATMRRGFEVMDRIQEGDIIESITITRRR